MRRCRSTAMGPKRMTKRSRRRSSQALETMIVTQTIGLKSSDGSHMDSEARDGTLQAYMRRLDAHQELLINQGKFSKEAAIRALASPDPATKEAAAKWLREGLATLREGERTPGKALARRGLASWRI